MFKDKLRELRKSVDNEPIGVLILLFHEILGHKMRMLDANRDEYKAMHREMRESFEEIDDLTNLSVANALQLAGKAHLEIDRLEPVKRFSRIIMKVCRKWPITLNVNAYADDETRGAELSKGWVDINADQMTSIPIREALRDLHFYISGRCFPTGTPPAAPAQQPQGEGATPPPPRRQGRGRKPISGEQETQRTRIVQAWASKLYATYQDLADKFGVKWNVVKNAVDADRKRRKKNAVKPD